MSRAILACLVLLAAASAASAQGPLQRLFGGVRPLQSQCGPGGCPAPAGATTAPVSAATGTLNCTCGPDCTCTVSGTPGQHFYVCPRSKGQTCPVSGLPPAQPATLTAAACQPEAPAVVQDRPARRLFGRVVSAVQNRPRLFHCRTCGG